MDDMLIGRVPSSADSSKFSWKTNSFFSAGCGLTSYSSRMELTESESYSWLPSEESAKSSTRTGSFFCIICGNASLELRSSSDTEGREFRFLMKLLKPLVIDLAGDLLGNNSEAVACSGSNGCSGASDMLSMEGFESRLRKICLMRFDGDTNSASSSGLVGLLDIAKGHLAIVVKKV